MASHLTTRVTRYAISLAALASVVAATGCAHWKHSARPCDVCCSTAVGHGVPLAAEDYGYELDSGEPVEFDAPSGALPERFEEVTPIELAPAEGELEVQTPAVEEPAVAEPPIGVPVQGASMELTADQPLDAAVHEAPIGDTCCELPGDACQCAAEAPCGRTWIRCPGCLAGGIGPLLHRLAPPPPGQRYVPPLPPKFLPVPTQPTLSPARPDAPERWPGDIEVGYRAELTSPGRD